MEKKSTQSVKGHARNLLLLSTKNVHFCFDSNIYQKNDGIAMGSPLGPVRLVFYVRVRTEQ